MNVLKVISRGMSLVSEVTQIALSLAAKQKPDTSGLANDLYNLITVDLKVNPHNATATKVSALLDDIFALFLP